MSHNGSMANSTPLTVTFVCTGNICRSPIGEVVLREKLAQAGIGEDRVRVTSSGTGDWHVGHQADPRALKALDDHGYDGSAHRASQFDPAQWPELDLVLALDDTHVRALRRLASDDADRAKIKLVKEFDRAAVAQGDREIEDPYYGGPRDFDRVIREVEAAMPGLVAEVQSRIGE